MQAHPPIPVVVKNGIRTRLLTWLILVILPIAAAMTFAMQVINTQLTESVRNDLAKTRTLESTRIRSVLDAQRLDAEKLASKALLRLSIGSLSTHQIPEEWVNLPAGDADELIDADLDQRFPLHRLARRLLGQASAVGSDFTALRLLGRNGDLLGETPGFSWQPFDPGIVERAMAERKTRFGNAFLTVGDEARLGLVTPVFNYQGTTIGALVIEADLAPIVTLTAEYDRLGNSMEAQLVQPAPGGRGEYITDLRFGDRPAFSQFVPLDTASPARKSLDSPAGQVLHGPDYRGVDSIFAIQTLEPPGWGVIVKIDAAEGYAQVRRTLRAVTIAGAATVLIVILGWSFYLRPLALRLQQASQAAERVAAGDYMKPISDKTRDEIGEMSRSIDRLAADLDDDIRKRAAVEAQLRYQASHDELTGLFNRKFANEVIRSLSSDGQTPVASILFLDLDGFKGINDKYGHGAGDEILITIAQRLSSLIQPPSILARWGGDEFVVVLPMTNQSEADALADQLRLIFDNPITTSHGRHYLGCSIGLCCSSPDRSLLEVLQQADSLMYAEKQLHHSRRALSTAAVRIVESALTERRVEVLYQPIVDVNADGGRRLVSAEALVRIRAMDGGLIPPMEFLPDIQESPIGKELDHRVIEIAVGKLAEWRREGLVERDFRMSINVTARSVRDKELFRLISRLVRRHDVPPSAIVLEISEQTNEIDHMTISKLQKIGIRVALDDVGITHSNLDRLVNLQPDIAKIDRSWLSSEGHATLTVTSVILPRLIELCQQLELTVVAEGVETLQQQQRLAGLGVTLLQGFLYDPALESKDFIQIWGQPFRTPHTEPGNQLRNAG